MGYYINPPGMTKEEFLQQVGVELNEPPAGYCWIDTDGTELLAVCLVDNGSFTAAGIAYSQEELEAFQSPLDSRPRRWFYVAIEDLKPYLSARLYADLTKGAQ